MNGAGDTYIDLTKSVDKHHTLAQQCLLLSVNVLGSDRLFPEKGTNLQAGVHNINLINNNYVQHLCNFAALNILSFLKEYTTYTEGDVEVSDVDMALINMTEYGESAKFSQKVIFSDGTSTNDVISV